MIYTSGSTGIPKGVMVEHHSDCAHLLQWASDSRIAGRVLDGVLAFASIWF